MEPEKTAEELKDVKYPDCIEACAAVKLLGLTECESISFCYWKFEVMDEAENSNQSKTT